MGREDERTGASSEAEKKLRRRENSKETGSTRVCVLTYLSRKETFSGNNMTSVFRLSLGRATLLHLEVNVVRLKTAKNFFKESLMFIPFVS